MGNCLSESIIPRKHTNYSMMVHLMRHCYISNSTCTSFIYHWHYKDTDSVAKRTAQKMLVKLNIYNTRSLLFSITWGRRLQCLHEYLVRVRLNQLLLEKKCYRNHQAQTFQTFRPGKMTLRQHKHILMCSLGDKWAVSMVTVIDKQQILRPQTAETS